MAFSTGDNNYANTRFIVSATPGQGNFTSIQSAINAATGPATIGIMPGTYTENITTKTGVNLCGMPSDGIAYSGAFQANNVIILGRIDISNSGNCTISNVTLQSNGGGILLANTANVQQFTLKNCQALVADTSFAVIQNANMTMDVYNCDVYLQNAASNFNMNNGLVNCYFCNFISDHAAMATNSTDGILGGTLNYNYCFSSCNVLSFFGGPSNFAAKYCDFEVSGTAGTQFSFTVSGTLSLEYCKISSGSNTAIDITSNTLSLFNNEITSSNTNAIVGSGGTLIHGGNTFTSSKLITVTTQTGIPLIVTEGGTGVNTMTSHGVVIGAATSPVSVTAAGTTGQVLTGVTGSDPVWASPATSGTVTSVSGTANQVNVANPTTTPVISLIGPYTPATYTAHGVLIGETTSSIVATAAGSAGQVLQSGGASADPSYSTATYPSTAGTSGNFLMSDGTNFVSQTPSSGTFTPTLIGASTAGSTTYVSQVGYYTKIGNFVFLYGYVQISAATGTGDALIGGLPFTVKNQSLGYPPGSLVYSGNASWPWPAGATMLNPLPLISSTTAQITGSGSILSSAQLQMANAGVIFYFSMSYQV